MPASLKDLRNKIKSVKGTQQITKAMKLVSAAKFGRAQFNVVNARPYASALAKLTSKLVGLTGESGTHPLLNPSDSKTALMVVISSERGLCGGYNSNIIKQAFKTSAELESQGYQVATVCIGKRAFQAYLRKRNLTLRKKEEPVILSEKDYAQDPTLLLGGGGLVLLHSTFDKPTSSMARRLCDAFEALYAKQKISKLSIVYNKFQSAITQIPSTEFVLPLQVSANEAYDAEPIFEPELSDLLYDVIPRYLTSKVFQTLIEAVASEHGARMTAMDNATRNAKEMQQKLQITYQRARQAAITKELIEIISGAEAL